MNNILVYDINFVVDYLITNEKEIYLNILLDIEVRHYSLHFSKLFLKSYYKYILHLFKLQNYSPLENPTIKYELVGLTITTE